MCCAPWALPAGKADPETSGYRLSELRNTSEISCAYTFQMWTVRLIVSSRIRVATIASHQIPHRGVVAGMAGIDPVPGNACRHDKYGSEVYASLEYDMKTIITVMAVCLLIGSGVVSVVEGVVAIAGGAGAQPMPQSMDHNGSAQPAMGGASVTSAPQVDDPSENSRISEITIQAPLPLTLEGQSGSDDQDGK